MRSDIRLIIIQGNTDFSVKWNGLSQFAPYQFEIKCFKNNGIKTFTSTKAINLKTLSDLSISFNIRRSFNRRFWNKIKFVWSFIFGIFFYIIIKDGYPELKWDQISSTRLVFNYNNDSPWSEFPEQQDDYEVLQE